MHSINEKEVLNKIKETIYDLYPITTPRIEENLQCTANAPEMMISINLYINSNFQTVNQISFLTGTSSYKNSQTNSFIVEGLIKEERIRELLTFLLNEFPLISDLSLEHQGFSLKFDIPLELETEKGISCKSITFKIETRVLALSNLINDYLKNIIENFNKEISNTPLFKIEYERYCTKSKKEIIESLTSNQLTEFIELLSKEELQSMLFNLPNERFIELYNNLSVSNINLPKELVKLK